MKKIITLILLAFCINSYSQTKLDKLTAKIEYSAKNEMKKVTKQASSEMSMKSGDIWTYEGSDCAVFIKDVQITNGIYTIIGEYSFKLNVFSDGKFLLQDFWTKKFNASAKEILDDFIVTEFNTIDEKK